MEPLVQTPAPGIILASASRVTQEPIVKLKSKTVPESLACTEQFARNLAPIILAIACKGSAGGIAKVRPELAPKIPAKMAPLVLIAPKGTGACANLDGKARIVIRNATNVNRIHAKTVRISKKFFLFFGVGINFFCCFGSKTKKLRKDLWLFFAFAVYVFIKSVFSA